MKATIFTYEYPPFRGGIAAYLKNFVDHAPNGIFAKVIQPPTGEHWLVSAWKSSVSARRGGCDFFIVSHVIPAGYVAWALKKFAGVPYAVIVHGTDIMTARRSSWKRRMMRFALKNAKLVIANSRFTAGLLKEEGITAAQVVPPGISPARHEMLAKGSGRKIVSVGRLAERKGFDMAVRALGIVRKEYPDATYAIIGKGSDLERLEKLIAEEELSGKAEIFSDADEQAKRAALAAASVFVLPARQVGTDIEGFGIVTLEAAAAGLPVIVSRSGGASEPVIDGVTGILLNDPGDPAELASAISGLFKNPDKAREMGAQGHAYVLSEYSDEKQAKKFWDLILKGIGPV